jgi:hypothetical protein
MTDFGQGETRGRMPGGRLTPEDVEQVRGPVSQFKLITVSLVTGVIFGVIVATVVAGPLILELPPSTLSLAIMGLSILVALPGFVIPSIIRRSTTNRRDIAALDVKTLSRAWLSAAFVGAAMLEGAGILNVVGLFLEKNILHLALAAIFAALIFVNYPRTNAMLDWVERVSSGR